MPPWWRIWINRSATLAIGCLDGGETQTPSFEPSGRRRLASSCEVLGRTVRRQGLSAANAPKSGRICFAGGPNGRAGVHKFRSRRVDAVDHAPAFDVAAEIWRAALIGPPELSGRHPPARPACP